MVLDAVAELDGGKKIDIEMQVDNRYDFRKRILFYICRLHQGKLGISENYAKIFLRVNIVISDYIESRQAMVL